MSVRRLKQFVGLAGAWLAVVAVSAGLAAAALSVVATGTGADPARVFTDPSDLLAMSTVTSWEPDSEWAQELDARTRADLESVWREVVHSLQSREPSQNAVFSEDVVRRLASSDAEAQISDTAVGAALLDVRFVSSGNDLVQLRAVVDVAQVVGADLVVEAERFDLTLVRQPAGWMVLALQRSAP